MHGFTIALRVKLAATIKDLAPFATRNQLEKLLRNQPTMAAPRSDPGFGVTRVDNCVPARLPACAAEKRRERFTSHPAKDLGWWAHKDSNLGPAD